jgi:hypothetical protein
MIHVWILTPKDPWVFGCKTTFFLLAKKSGRWQVAAYSSRNKPTSFHPSLTFSPEGKTLVRKTTQNYPF